jgi:hypothetical protein
VIFLCRLARSEIEELEQAVSTALTDIAMMSVVGMNCITSPGLVVRCKKELGDDLLGRTLTDITVFDIHSITYPPQNLRHIGNRSDYFLPYVFVLLK